MIDSDDELSASCRTSSAAGCGSNTPSKTIYKFRSKKYKSDEDKYCLEIIRCLSPYLSIYLYIYMSIYLSIYLSIYS